jgi:hypothetical protein
VFVFTAIVWIELLPLQLPGTTFGNVAPIDLKPMVTTGVPLSDIMIVLTFAAAAAAAVASTFGGGGVGVCINVALLRESCV